MTLQLDHTIVRSRDKVRAAQFFARMFDLEYRGPWGHFAPVKVNDTLTLDFDNAERVQSNHYAFLATDADFDAILGRVQAEGIAFGSGPSTPADGEINHRHGGRGFYFKCEDGHLWEVITHTYVTD